MFADLVNSTFLPSLTSGALAISAMTQIREKTYDQRCTDLHPQQMEDRPPSDEARLSKNGEKSCPQHSQERETMRSLFVLTENRTLSQTNSPASNLVQG